MSRLSIPSRVVAWLVPLVAVASAGGLVAAGASAPAPSAATEVPSVRTEPVSGVSLFCPGTLASPETSGGVAALSLPDLPEDVTSGAGDPLLSASGLVDVDAGEGSDAGSQEPGELGSVQERGQTLAVEAADPQRSVSVRADGPLAPGATADVTTSAAGERTSGLAGQPCVEPAREWWFLAGSGDTGRRSTLVLGNVADGAAVVDVEVWTEIGQLQSPGTNDLGVPARGTRTISIDALAAGTQQVAVRVRVSVGKVGAAMLLREVSGADPIGLSWVTASQPPSTLAYIPGLPAFGERVLRLTNPGEDDAIASLRAVAGQGPFTPLGLEAIDVPAQSVVDVDLEPAGEEAFALEVASNQPVASSVLLRQTPDSGLGDLAVLGSAAALDNPAASRVTTADGRSSRVVLTALPEPLPEGDAPAPTPEPTPESTDAPPAAQSPDPTPDPTPDATAAASPDATPDGSPEATPDASPEATPEPLVEVATPTVSAVVRLLADDGSVLVENEATLGVGTTDTFPVEVPDGTESAWLVVVPDEPGTLLAARETTTTVSVPDPLDEEAEREAFWFDVVPLRSVRTTVDVPPVLPDITAGLPR